SRISLPGSRIRNIFHRRDSMKRKGLLRSAAHLGVAFSLLVLFAISVLAQQGTSSIRGTVKDPQGNVVAGATVKLNSVSKSIARTTTTTGDGNFSFEAVPVSDYTIEVEAAGFKKGVITDVHALVSSPTPVEVVLEIGSVNESVTVAANSAELLVNRDDATLGSTFVNKQITQLPLEARNVPSLLTFRPPPRAMVMSQVHAQIRRILPLMALTLTKHKPTRLSAQTPQMERTSTISPHPTARSYA